MSINTERTHLPRSPRIRSQPGRFNNYVRFSTDALSDNANDQAAQFADVSNSGMRLISRLPMTGQIGDLVRLEFELAGSQRRIKNRARIVRKTNEFEFAVRFLNAEDEIQQAIDEHILHQSRTRALEPIRLLTRWVREHRTGLWIALIGTLIFSAIGSMIYFNSDQYHGRQLRPWGATYPQKWDLDYISKFGVIPNQESKAQRD